MSFPVPKDYRCCNRHIDYPTPVVGTFKFNGREFWCPHCGAKYEMFDGFKYYPINYKMSLRYHMFCILSLDYLSDKTEEYKFEQRPDAIFGLMSEADIALTLFNLGFRYSAEHLVVGSVLYTLTKKKIIIVEDQGFLYFENEEATQRKPICELKKFDVALLPSAEFAADFFIKSMNP